MKKVICPIIVQLIPIVEEGAEEVEKEVAHVLATKQITYCINYCNAKVTYLLCLEMFQCNEEGHLSYNCPTGPTRGRGGGRGGGGGSTRPCFKVTSVTSIKLLLQN